MNKNSILNRWATIQLPKLYYILPLLFTMAVQAQNQTIKGTITDVSGTLQGVTIKVKDKPTATLTDEKGNYTIEVVPTDMLVFSFIGYKIVEIPVTNRSTINVQLQEDTTTLKEVVINAGYYSVKDKERTGSISKVSSKEIEKQPVTNVLAALQGRMAGVNITQTTGVPGGGFNIQIRGRNSIRTEGNQPLYIVDGLPFSSENLGNTAISGGILPGAGINPLNNINPSDIDSIEILKDADATAIYGSRGANGVVLVTTKKGKKGKTQFSFNTYTGAGTITRRLKLLNTQQYLEMREEAFANDGITTLPSWAYDVNGTWDRNRYTDWQKELIGGTAISRNVEVGVSGGTGTTQFLIRGTNFNETTVFPGDFSYGKSALHFNINHTSEDNRFAINLSGNYVADKNNLLSTDLTRNATTLAPNAPALYDEDGNLNWENGTWENPLRLLQGKYLAKTKGLYLGGALGYKVLSNLEFKSSFGYNDTRVEESSTTPHTIYNPAFGLTSAASSSMASNSNQQSWSVEPQLNYQKSFAKSKLKLLVGSTFQERSAAQLAVFASGFTSNSLIANSAAASFTQIMNNATSMYRYTAVFGRANYSINDKYFFNLTGRRDGSSRFGSGNRFANFAALGTAWIFSNESVVNKALPYLSFGKLRASYGTTGSDQIGDYQFLNTYTPTGIPYNGTIGLEPSRLFNPNFSWEVNKKLEMALDLGFVNDRIFLTTAFFKNRSSNQLVGIPLPGTTGFNSIQANLEATVENSGLEIELRTSNFNRNNFKWTTSWNLTLPKNKLLAFPNLEGSVYAKQYVIGQSLSIRKVYEFTGVNPNTGIYEFTDFNGDGLLTATEDRQKIVDTAPKFFGGVQNSLAYKNWQLDFLLQFVKQVGINNNAVADLPGSASNMTTDVLDHWQQIGDTNPTQVYTAGFNGDAVNAFYTYYASSDAAFSDASYIRLKNLSFSYTVPNTMLKKVNCKLYFQAQNLLTFTKFKGADPENQSQGRLPILRVLTIGTQLNF
ncbi:TonB-linked outer membrane protein, SusC/RagA family [Flavobacterium psychrophilum DSM 3660]|uniref:SusC/RagA family TonB-linked outer membrane protein n=1 Tax=Flavobacterium psychrophilum TaxID=96345 RepID=UPI00068A6AE2|nr:SusC/RagA family TonB-linked outer membrane protein [Flavobacterium psychrophilum]OXB14067.1 SusC/RagA family protein [Flavobacterium psychrophilum DSM 3660 = ATCC 49418]SCX75238.1 TonB-linked outer membrane protein, SusC/RagA family [Flavobacterium psychrophilum DSM 3660] [Flavobacterium psychrophilum DSM 3660 = ATCC 49418]SHH92504.1 SusC-like TonB-dependent outer membrane receptor precursor [Flavobacterium psychrophilum]